MSSLPPCWKRVIFRVSTPSLSHRPMILSGRFLLGRGRGTLLLIRAGRVPSNDQGGRKMDAHTRGTPLHERPGQSLALCTDYASDLQRLQTDIGHDDVGRIRSWGKTVLPTQRSTAKSAAPAHYAFCLIEPRHTLLHQRDHQRSSQRQIRLSADEGTSIWLKFRADGDSDLDSIRFRPLRLGQGVFARLRFDCRLLSLRHLLRRPGRTSR